MRARIIWFAAGSAAGVYATAKARRVAYRLSMPGVVDQAAALGIGWREFTAELREGMHTHERHMARELFDADDEAETLSLPGPHSEIPPPDKRLT